MPVIYTSLAIIGAFAAVAVVIGAIVVLRPLYQPPYETGDWIWAVFSGLAAVLTGSAGIAVGLGADSYSVLSWTEVVVGGLIAVIGVVLTVIGVWIYEPTPNGDEPA